MITTIFRSVTDTPLLHPADIPHTLYHCPIYAWSASAHGRHWLYAEYRDATGASRYACFSFASAQALLQFTYRELPTESLAGIDPDQTRNRPISASAARARA